MLYRNRDVGEKIIAVRESVNTKSMKITLSIFEFILLTILAVCTVVFLNIWWIFALVLAVLIVVFLSIHIYIGKLNSINKLPKQAITYDGFKMFALVNYQGRFKVFFPDIISINAIPAGFLFFKFNYGTIVIKTKHMTFKLKNIASVYHTGEHLKYLVEKNGI